MHAIILSAGQGSRLLPATAEKPKCLIEFAGKSLIDWQLDALEANGVNSVTVVLGFKDDLVEKQLAARRGPARVETIFNPFYKVADNLGSVWLARHRLEGDCLILNGDTLVSERLVAKAIGEAKAGINVTVDEKPAYDADDMKVVREADGRLRAIGKRLGEAGVNAESIGLIRFKAHGAAQFRDAVDAMMRTSEGTTSWYLKVIHRIAQEARVETTGIMGEQWAEVDFPQDLEAAERLVQSWRSLGRTYG